MVPLKQLINVLCASLNNNFKITRNQNTQVAACPNNFIYHIIYKLSNRNKVHDKFGIMYFENQITMQIRSRD